MTDLVNRGAIHVKDINLWAHVGVLEEERLLGQRFIVDFSLWFDLDCAAQNDDISATHDYSIAIRALNELSSEICCQTIEYFSEKILDLLEELYGPIPMRVILKKCNPPVSGFIGNVSVDRSRNPCK